MRLCYLSSVDYHTLRLHFDPNYPCFIVNPRRNRFCIIMLNIYIDKTYLSVGKIDWGKHLFIIKIFYNIWMLSIALSLWEITSKAYVTVTPAETLVYGRFSCFCTIIYNCIAGKPSVLWHQILYIGMFVTNLTRRSLF